MNLSYRPKKVSLLIPRSLLLKCLASCDGKVVCVCVYQTPVAKTMASLQEHCAMTLFESSVHQRKYDVFNKKWARCACDFFEDFYINDYKTKEFIRLLPLPVAVKGYLHEVAKKICDEDHPEEAEEEEEVDELERECIGSINGCDCDNCWSSYASSSYDEAEGEGEENEEENEEEENEESSIDETEGESGKEEEKEEKVECNGIGCTAEIHRRDCSLVAQYYQSAAEADVEKQRD